LDSGAGKSNKFPLFFPLFFSFSQLEKLEFLAVTTDINHKPVGLHPLNQIDLRNLRHLMAELSNTESLKAIIYPRSTIALVAKYAFDVLELFYAVPAVFRLSEANLG
jgi:hypothetical protein